MEITTKEKRKYTYLSKSIDTNISIYFEEKSGKFYSFQNQVIDKKWGFSAMFLAPLSIILRNTFIQSTKNAYFTFCICGIILGIISLYFLHKSYSSDQLIEIELSNEEIEHCIENLKQVKQIKITLIGIWLFLFTLMSVMFFDEKNYISLLSLSLLCCFLIPLIENLNFLRDNRVKKSLMLKIN
ncbi:hypothetical protein [Enterococcus sp. AZ192]|uniref:hypothetical protein n=1 Tax=unclassified Enterococcus TaxID=2608891 RepID=UPI003D2E0D7D